MPNVIPSQQRVSNNHVILRRAEGSPRDRTVIVHYHCSRQELSHCLHAMRSHLPHPHRMVT